MNHKKAIIWVAVSTEAQASDNKISIPNQIESANNRAKSENWQIIDTMIVDGFSRHYIDIHEFASDLLRQKQNDSGYRLIQHLQSGDFDVLWCRDADRLGRESSMIHFITGYIRKHDLKIYVENTQSYVDTANMLTWGTFKAYEATHYVIENQRKVNEGLANRVKNGLPLGTQVIRTHEYILDDRNKPIDVRIKDGIDVEFKRLADLLLYGNDNGDKISWRDLESVMFKRWGYGENNKPYTKFTYKRLLHTPLFWGHLTKGAKGKGLGMYLIRDANDVPDDCIMIYDVLPHCAVYTSDLAIEVIQNIELRKTTSGRANQKTKAYSGILCCAYCLSAMSYISYPNHTYLRCADQYAPYTDSCDQNRQHPIADIDNYIDKLIQKIIESGDAKDLLPSQIIDLSVDDQIDETERMIADTISRRNRILDLVERADDNLLSVYHDRIASLTVEIEQHQTRLVELKQKNRQYENHVRTKRMALKQMQNITFEQYEKLSGYQKNMLLKKILGATRIAVDYNGVVGYTQAKRKYHRNRKKK